MWWYVFFTVLFLVYQADVFFYSIVALVACCYERAHPPPGHPAYARWRRRQRQRKQRRREGHDDAKAASDDDEDDLVALPDYVGGPGGTRVLTTEGGWVLRIAMGAGESGADAGPVDAADAKAAAAARAAAGFGTEEHDRAALMLERKIGTKVAAGGGGDDEEAEDGGGAFADAAAANANGNGNGTTTTQPRRRPRWSIGSGGGADSEAEPTAAVPPSSSSRPPLPPGAAAAAELEAAATGGLARPLSGLPLLLRRRRRSSSNNGGEDDDDSAAKSSRRGSDSAGGATATATAPTGARSVAAFAIAASSGSASPACTPTPTARGGSSAAPTPRSSNAPGDGFGVANNNGPPRGVTFASPLLSAADAAAAAALPPRQARRLQRRVFGSGSGLVLLAEGAGVEGNHGGSGGIALFEPTGAAAAAASAGTPRSGGGGSAAGASSAQSDGNAATCALALAGACVVPLMPRSLVACYTGGNGSNSSNNNGSSGNNSGFPLVLVQLPMFNEQAHCEVVIERACRMAWPRDRLIVQVCDDSTLPEITARVDARAAALAQAGHNVMVHRRARNVGYKAGNMLAALKVVEGLPWTHVAVFDADFEMPADFLLQTIFHLERDAKLGFVQARWTFETNAGDNLLTWAQRVGMDFHFAVEQRARSFLRTFFGFNGTAGVWRRAAMEAAGGWSTDTTVEDMDLALKAYLRGWRFKYLQWCRCDSELPPTLQSYKTQQRRWQSGPMALLRTTARQIWRRPNVRLIDRLSCTYFFFRFVYSAFLTLITLLCPPVVLWLDPWAWGRPQVGFLVVSNASVFVFVWFCGLLFWPYLLFQAVIGYFRVYAMVLGLVGAEKAKGWKVTAKIGRSASSSASLAGGGGGGGASFQGLGAFHRTKGRVLSVRPPAAAALALLSPPPEPPAPLVEEEKGANGAPAPGPAPAPSRPPHHRPYALELVVAAYYLAMAAASAWKGVYLMTSFCWIMAWSFVGMSFGDYLF